MTNNTKLTSSKDGLWAGSWSRQRRAKALIEDGAQTIGSDAVTGRQPSHLPAARERPLHGEMHQLQLQRGLYMARINRMGCLGAVFLFVKTR